MLITFNTLSSDPIVIYLILISWILSLTEYCEFSLWPKEQRFNYKIITTLKNQ